MKIMDKQVKISRSEWRFIGRRNGWLPSVLSVMAAKNNAFIKTAGNTNEITDDQIKQAIRNNLVWTYHRGYVLREDNEIVNEALAKEATINAFFKLIKRDSNLEQQIKAYIANERPFKLSMFFSKEGSNKYLIPSFNGVGLTNLKTEFSGAIPFEISEPPADVSLNIGNAYMKEAKDLKDIFSMANAAGYIANKAKIAIGSIGSKGGTNWDTSYALHIEGVPAPMLEKILTWFTDITNEDQRNAYLSPNKNTFDLTQRDEVAGLLLRLGLKDEYTAALKDIKTFEQEKGLKQTHRSKGRIDNYRDKTKVNQIDLSVLQDKIFQYLMDYVTNNPNYVKMLNDANISNIQDELNVAFSEGAEGTLLTEQDLANLIEMAVAA